MKKRVIIPVEDQKGIAARLAEHFGRAPYYAIVDIDVDGNISDVKTVPNIGEHAGGIGHSHDKLLEYEPTAIIAYGIGPRGLTSFQSTGVAVLKANAATVGEVVNAYKLGKLQVLTESCKHAHNH